MIYSDVKHSLYSLYMYCWDIRKVNDDLREHTLSIKHFSADSEINCSSFLFSMVLQVQYCRCHRQQFWCRHVAHSFCLEKDINMMDCGSSCFPQTRQNISSRTCIPNKAEDEHRWTVLNEASFPRNKHTEVIGLMI